jgi:vacuolar-type H+-ATPase subunit F/Vma7
MSGIVVIGQRTRVEGFALAGVRVAAADDEQAIRKAWPTIDQDVTVLILTPIARATLANELASRPELIWTVIPD